MGAYSCYECEKRFPGCHATCKTYQEEKALRDAKIDEYQKKRRAQIGVYEQKKDGVIRANRRNGRK